MAKAEKKAETTEETLETVVEAAETSAVEEVAETEQTEVTTEAKPKAKSKKEKFVKKDLSQVDAKQLAEMQADYRKLALDVRMGLESNTSKLRATRRDIARAQTLLNSKVTN